VTVKRMKGIAVGKGWLSAILLGAALTARADCPPGQTLTVQAGPQTWRVEVAETPAARERGLSERDRLVPGTGMLFPFEAPFYAGFWMKGMRFSLDIVWIGPDQRVLGVTAMVPCTGDPCPVAFPPAPTALVLEVNQGEFAGAPGTPLSWRCEP
jgi:uncharacterized membrane protein (UPF0127 family)